MLRARVAGWPERVEASQGGSVEWLTPCLREVRAIFSILLGSSGHERSRRPVWNPGAALCSDALRDQDRTLTVARARGVRVRLSRSEARALTMRATALPPDEIGGPHREVGVNSSREPP